MGLTSNSTGKNAVDNGLNIKKESQSDKILALAGNPNVGKSTVFNELTGMHQHTGNWPGKTVSNAQGSCKFDNTNYILVDLPGTYSLMAHSAEEEVARDFICFGKSDAVIVVCDASCLERNLNLVLQITEITNKVVVCVNLMDEAKRKHIDVNLKLLKERLCVPVVGTSARSGKGLDNLMRAARDVSIGAITPTPVKIKYLATMEKAISTVESALENINLHDINRRWLAIKLLDFDQTLIDSINNYLNIDLLKDPALSSALEESLKLLEENNIKKDDIKDRLTSCLVLNAESICDGVAVTKDSKKIDRDRKLDKVLTSKLTGIPIMILLLCVVFWITITGANYPSQLLSKGLFYIQDKLTELFHYLNAPEWLHGALVLGVYRVLAWVIAVMLPPMAIFFPLFTLLEDFGYLPRVAFNLDHRFKKANTCGKQALTMCMGFGCNAAGVVGCRIIDSPRERIIASITNNFVPCNGRFPTLISIITMFFISSSLSSSFLSSIVSTLFLTLIIVFGVFLTFVTSKFLSKTLLKGLPSSFALELPPYRRPQIGKVIVRSIFDRTLFVLGRAASVAAPAGLIIWLFANITVDGASLLAHISAFLDPFAKLLGLDGVILLAFILGFPANEIVFPIIIMAYMATGSIAELDNLTLLKQLLIDNGWTWVTAVSTMIFCLVHWPCSTTCLTIKKETQSLKWTAISVALPTVIGMGICFLFNLVVKLFSLA